MVDLSKAAWRKASSCTHSDCVEVAFVSGHVALRDSKRPDASVLVFSPTEWAAFVGGVHRGEFDPVGQPHPHA